MRAGPLGAERRCLVWIPNPCLWAGNRPGFSRAQTVRSHVRKFWSVRACSLARRSVSGPPPPAAARKIATASISPTDTAVRSRRSGGKRPDVIVSTAAPRTRIAAPETSVFVAIRWAVALRRSAQRTRTARRGGAPSTSKAPAVLSRRSPARFSRMNAPATTSVSPNHRRHRSAPSRKASACARATSARRGDPCRWKSRRGLLLWCSASTGYGFLRATRTRISGLAPSGVVMRKRASCPVSSAM